MKKRNLLIIGVLVVTILLSSFGFYAYQVFFSPNFQVDKDDEYLYIPTGATFADVQKLVYDEGFVNDAVSFGFISKLMEYDQLVKPGRYLIKKNSDNISVIRMLRAGEQVPVRVTFTNIRLIDELAEKLSSYLEVSKDTLMEKLTDPAVYTKYNFNQETFRCMFIPNTYEMYWNTSADRLLEKMHTEYERFWNDDRMQKAKALELTPVQVTILASIVESESRHTDESPMIAGLYLNRLNINMPLQADPTLKYAVGDFSIQRVLNKHKEIDSPYNTYKYAGLPPGPIVFPSIKSIDAVLNHKDHNYLYMCAREDFSGYHNFSTNLREHLNNARRYQQELNNRNLY